MHHRIRTYLIGLCYNDHVSLSGSEGSIMVILTKFMVQGFPWQVTISWSTMPLFFWNLRFHHWFHKWSPLEHILSHFVPVHIIINYISKILLHRIFKKYLYSRNVVAGLQHAEIGNMVTFVYIGSTDLWHSFTVENCLQVQGHHFQYFEK